MTDGNMSDEETGSEESIKQERPAEEIEIVEGYRADLQRLPTKKIAVLGTCPSRFLAPVDDMSWEIWTIGPGGKDANRWERLFEIHGKDSWPDGFREYLQELQAVQPPKIIYTESAMPDWPANVVIPKEQLFAKHGRMWFTSSISYAIAMAIEENVTDLGIFGIDLESGEEYRSQFMGAKHFIHLARLAGITMHMPKGCGLLRDPAAYPEAWETHLADTLSAKLEYLGQLIAEKRAAHGQLAAEINHLDGEMAAFNFVKSLYVIHGEEPGRHVQTQQQSLESKIDQILNFAKSR